MKKSIIKVLSVVLVVVITLTSAPLSGVVGLELPEWLDFSIMSEAATTSGECGENVYWSYNATTYTLTISGTGDMNNYSDFYHISPWESYEDSIKKVVINKGVKSIGECAFYSCSSLTNVTIGDGVTSIDSCAFEYCTALTSITIPDSITSIGENAFDDCNSLKSVYISDVSAWCNITFNNTVSNPLYKGADLYLNGAMVTDLVIPHDVTKLNDYVFYNCKSITHVAIGDNVTSIGKYAFYNCTSLTSVVIGDSVTSIGNYAFYNCRGLTSVTIGDSVTSIGYYAFFYCTSLKSVYISDISAWCNITFNNASSNPLNSGASLYLNGTKVTDLVIPDDVTKLNNYVFYSYDSITSITIPKSVTAIGKIAFVGCTNLTSITVDCNNQYFFSNEDGVLFNKDKTALIQYPIGNTRTSYTIPDSVTSIDSCAFAYCTSLKNVTIPDSVTSIDSCAFIYCTRLTSITIPDSVTSIGDSTFSDCTSLTSVTIGDSVTSIGEMAFRDCTRLTSITIPDSVTSIGDMAFRDCESLVSVSIQNNVTIGDSAFWGCTKLASITIGNGVMISDDAFSYTAYYSDTNNWENNVLYIGNYLIEANSNISGDYIVKSGTCAIADKAFYEQKNLTSITIPNSVISIGSYAFYYCDSLESVLMGNRVASIGTQAFYYCTALTGVYITNLSNWCSIDFCSSSSNPLYYANNLYINGKLATDIVISDTVDKIGKYAFYKCTSLKSVVIGKNVTHIGESAFDYCGEITSFTFGENIKSIDDWAFAECNKLESVYITNLSAWCNIEFGHRVSNPLYYADDLYLNNQRITELVIPNDVTSINDYSFCIWKNLVSVDVPDNVTSIGVCAFNDCTSLTSVTIPDSVKTIGDSAFSGCKRLASVTIPDSVKTIGDYSFASCDSLTNVTIPNSVTTIGERAFDGCDSLTSITVDSNNQYYSSDEYGVLFDKDKTTLIQYPIGNKGTSYTIPDSVTTIGDLAFGYCSSLKSVTISDSVTTIGDYAFYNCNKLRNVYYSGIETQWNAISIGSSNGSLLNATIHYNYHIHRYSSVLSAPTCTDRGYTTYTCACGDTFIDNYVDALGHNYSTEITTPTCTDRGYTTYTCSVCGDTYIDNYVDALGHTDGDIVEQNYVAPTCTETGSKDNVTYCTVCNAETSRNETIIDALGHNYATEITSPTCTDRGYTTYTCSVCGDTYTSDYVDALGHTEEEIPAVAPTCTEIGLTAGMKCSVCDKILTAQQELPSSGHMYCDVVVNLPSCTDQGYTTYTCICGESYVGDYTDAIGHDFENGTCTECDVIDPDYFTFEIQNPSRTTIRCNDGIKLHTSVTGNLPEGSRIEWSKNNSNFNVNVSDSGNEITIISMNNGYTTFTATVYDADNKVIAEDTIEMYSKASFFDKIGGFFRSIFGGTTIYEN